VAAAPADLALRSALEFHCSQLARQRDLLHSVWLWCLLPFVPGMVMFVIGMARVSPDRLAPIVVYGIGCVILMVGLHVLNRRVAARIQRRLDRLNELG